MSAYAAAVTVALAGATVLGLWPFALGFSLCVLLAGAALEQRRQLVLPQQS
jgi:hypothetical protein